MTLTNLNEKIKNLSDDKIDDELKGKKNIKTFKYDAVASMELAKKFVVITTKKDNDGVQFMHIDIEDPSEIIKDFGLELVV